MSFTLSKKHKFTSPTQFSQMDPLEMVEVSPTSIHPNILSRSNNRNELSPNKQKILNQLLMMKELEKPLTKENRRKSRRTTVERMKNQALEMKAKNIFKRMEKLKKGGKHKTKRNKK